MMKINLIRTNAILRLLIVIPLLTALIIAIVSCSASRKASKTPTEMTPPPPPSPPPPPPPAPTEVFIIVEEMPQFPGGETALMKFIVDNIKYPEAARNKGIQGRVMLKFVVTANGNIDQVEVVRGVDPLLDQEAIRVIKMMPLWTPGRQGGKAVNVWYTIPVTFALNGASSGMPRYIVAGNDTVFTFLKEMPQFPGGNIALGEFKKSKIQYPPQAKNAGFGGTVIIGFIVGKDGALSDFSIISGVSPSIDAEALRVAKQMPPWLPGKENGRPVKVKYSTMFQFWLNPEDEEKQVYIVVEEMPKFPGGDSTLMKFISDNIKYPQSAKDKKIEGRVVLRFCINKLGGVEQVVVLRGIDPALDAEAIRVVKSLPAWQPGKQDGKPVNTWFALPITFSLGTPGETKSPVTQTAPPPPPPPPPAPPLITGYDEPPLFPGGETGLAKFIESEKKYPQVAKDKNISGTVKISFRITETGKVERPALSLSIDPLLDAEALRVVGLIPDWQPAKLKGKPVSVSYTIPVNFKL